MHNILYILNALNVTELMSCELHVQKSQSTVCGVQGGQPGRTGRALVGISLPGKAGRTLGFVFRDQEPGKGE